MQPESGGVPGWKSREVPDGSKSINTLDAYVIKLFKWRTKREPVMVNHAVVCSDVGIVAMRTFIEMTADSFTFYAWFCKNINNKTSVYF